MRLMDSLPLASTILLTEIDMSSQTLRLPFMGCSGCSIGSLIIRSDSYPNLLALSQLGSGIFPAECNCCKIPTLVRATMVGSDTLLFEPPNTLSIKKNQTHLN